jgi:hypothetical protein
LSKRLRDSLDKPISDLALQRPRRHPAVAWLQRLIRGAANRFAELVLWRGVETSEKQVELDHFHPDRGIYQPSGWGYLRRGLRKSEVTPEDVFVDFGSGKGRVLCQAARYPFGRVIGVEISPALTRVARLNLDRNRRRFACRQVELVTADVADYEIPDDVTYAYLFHPFAGDTFEVLIDRLVESIERWPRRLTIIYACPGLESYILASGHFHRARTSRGGFGDFLYRRVSVYVHDPSV